MTLCGQHWRALLPLLGAGERYTSRVKAAGEGDGARLLAHAYVRYLGDLSGGQILDRLLSRSLGLGPRTLSFHEFPDIADLEGFKLAYRDAIDRAAAAMIDVEAVIEEAAVAFQLNMDVSEAVQRFPSGSTAQPGSMTDPRLSEGHFDKSLPCNLSNRKAKSVVFALLHGSVT